MRVLRAMWRWVGNFGNIQFLLSIGGSTLVTVVTTWILSEAAEMPPPVLAAVAIGTALVSVALFGLAVKEIEHRFGSRWGDSSGTVRQQSGSKLRIMPQPSSHWTDDLLQEATPEELAQNVITDRTVFVADLVRARDSLSFEQMRFMNCDIVGPAIIVPRDVTFLGTAFDMATREVENIILGIDAGTWPMGVTTFGECVFTDCRLRGIALGVPVERVFERRRTFAESLGLPPPVPSTGQSDPDTSEGRQ